MRRRTLKQAFLALTQIIITAVCLSAPALAQAPNPTPPPRQINEEETSEPTKISFSEALTKLAERAGTLLPAVQQQVEGPLLPWLEKLSVGLAFFVMMIAFAKIWRENEGAGTDLIWWFARLGVVFALLGNGPKIVDGMSAMGNEIANGNEVATGVRIATPLATFYETQKNNFNNSYKSFIDGVFTVKTTGEAVAPASGGLGIMGAVTSAESSEQDPIRKFEGVPRNMPLLFDSLDLSRGVLSFGDFFLTALQSFLMIAMRLAAPVMIALAIDRSLARKITYPFAWGLVVLTFVWPIVVLIIKAIAYMAGNIAMGLGDGKQFHTFDENTMRIIQNGDPFYTVVFASLIMLIAGLSLWGSPYIAYQLSVGRVYEGVSSTISGWVGHLVGAGIGYYGALAAAEYTRQADLTRAEGAKDAANTIATYQKSAQDKIAAAAKLEKYLSADANRNAGNRNVSSAASFGKDLINQSFNREINDSENDLRRDRQVLALKTLQEFENLYNDNDAALTGSVAKGITGAVEVGGKASGLGSIMDSVGGAVGSQAKFRGKSQALFDTVGEVDASRPIGRHGYDHSPQQVIAGSHLDVDRVLGKEPKITGLQGVNWNHTNQKQLNSAHKAIGDSKAFDDNAGRLTRSNDILATDLKRAYGTAYQLIAGPGGANEDIYKGALKAAAITNNSAIKAANLQFNANIIRFWSDEFRRTAERTIPLRF